MPNIGIRMEMTMKTTIPPSTTMMNGSSSEVIRWDSRLRLLIEEDGALPSSSSSVPDSSPSRVMWTTMGGRRPIAKRAAEPLPLLDMVVHPSSPARTNRFATASAVISMDCVSDTPAADSVDIVRVKRAATTWR